MSLTKRILTNTLWQVLGRGIVAILGIISIKIITNYLPTDAYGQYTTLYEFIAFFAIAADFGLYTIGVREMAKQQKPTSEILANILSIRIILIILTLTASSIVVQFIPKYANTFISHGIYLVAITTALTLLHGTLTSVLQFELKMFYANISLIIGKLITVGYIAFAVFFLSPNNIEKGFTQLLYAGIFGGIIMVALTAFYVSKHSKIYLDFNWRYTKELVLKALPYGMSLVLSTLYFKIDIILLSLMRDYHETGIYGVPLKLMEILTVIPAFFMNSSLPIITQSFHRSKEEFIRIIRKCWTFLLLAATPLVIGGTILAFPLTFAISNPQFLSGYHCVNNIKVVTQSAAEATKLCADTPIEKGFNWTKNTQNLSPFTYLQGSDIALKLILFGMFFSFLNSLFAFTLVAIDKQASLLYINGIGLLFNLVTNLIFIPKYGFIGASITTILSEIIILIGTYIACRRVVKIQIPGLDSLKILFAGGIMGTIIIAIQPITYKLLENLNLILLIPIGAITYFIALYLLKVISHDEIRKILKRV